MNNLVIVMSAGASTRFKTTKSKLLQDLAGDTVLSYLLRTLKKINNVDILFVVKHQKDLVKQEVEKYLNEVSFVEQKKLDGTGGAVRDALATIDKTYDRVLVLAGDTPLIPVDLIEELLKRKEEAFVVGIEGKERTYGRFLLDEYRRIQKIVEPQGPEYPNTADIINTSIYSFSFNFLKEYLGTLSKNAVKDEIFLTDILEVAVKNAKAEYLVLENTMKDKVLGPNTLASLAKLANTLYLDRANKFLTNGVYIMDPTTTKLGPDISIAKDVFIYPNTFIYGNTEIGEAVVIYEGVRIESSSIGKNTEIKPYSVIYNSTIGMDNQIGPFAHIRFNTNTKSAVKIGAYSETKNSIIGEKSKIPHLSYVGDAELGKKVNIGCGVITCNYDGFKKNKTTIGDNVFVGSDSQLIAPINLGSGSYVAAGTTVTKNVPEDALAISRTKQVNKEAFVKKFKERKQNA